MPFSAQQIANFGQTIEKQFWSKRRPPLKLRDKIREGQRIEGFVIDLFYMRPPYTGRGEWVAEPIVRTRYSPTRGVWKIYWMRADLKWHAYKPVPKARSLAKVLQVVDEDQYCCFFG